MRQQIANVLLVIALLLSAGVTFSASGPDEPESRPAASEDIESIVITGQRPGGLKKLMLNFVVEIGNPTSRGRGYARWRNSLCVGVFNLPDQTVAQYIADRITITALELGLKTGSPGCQPNMSIIFSPDARALASGMVENSPLLFHPFGHQEGTTQGPAALDQFKSSEAPVRWWQVTMVVDEVGSPAITLPGISLDAPTVRGVASRLKSPISDAIWSSLVIVDASKLDNVKWPQLADYLAMVSLVQVDPNARPASYDSILNLFSANTRPGGMTDMDRTYLRALYEMDTMMLPHTQRGVLSSTMVRVQRKMEEE